MIDIQESGHTTWETTEDTLTVVSVRHNVIPFTVAVARHIDSKYPSDRRPSLFSTGKGF